MFDLIQRTPWSVFDELESLQADMNRAFSDWDMRDPRARLARRAVYPPMNVWSSDEGLVIDAELPGIDPNAVEISVKGDELTVRGQVGGSAENAEATVYRRERPEGAFMRTLRLPFRASSEKVGACYRNGILRIKVPRSEDEKPRKIAIQA